MCSVCCCISRQLCICLFFFFFFQAEDGIRDKLVTGVQTCALPICGSASHSRRCQGRRRSSRSAGRCRTESPAFWRRSEEHTSELQSLAYLVCRLLLEKKKKIKTKIRTHCVAQPECVYKRQQPTAVH